LIEQIGLIDWLDKVWWAKAGGWLFFFCSPNKRKLKPDFLLVFVQFVFVKEVPNEFVSTSQHIFPISTLYFDYYEKYKAAGLIIDGNFEI
jgi:hypothetical protein